jgi:hypothetical protein
VDYPLLNLAVGLVMALAATVSVGLAVVVSKAWRGAVQARLSWLAVALSLPLAAYAAYVLVAQMLPGTRWQFAFGVAVIVGLVAVATVRLYPMALSAEAARAALVVQWLSSAVAVVIGLGLLRSLVAIGSGP